MKKQTLGEEHKAKHPNHCQTVPERNVMSVREGGAAVSTAFLQSAQPC